MATTGLMNARRDWLWPAVALLVLVGFALRIAAAQGALWLDEAWSAVNAADAGTPLGVLFRIDHDNNHHLNTLWLQLVGLGAPPPVQRGLSIVTGTATILIAAWIARRSGKGAALAAAALFALSPLLVNYGSEARGYAPMLCALLVMVALILPRLDDQAARIPAIPLAFASLLGTLAQLTMVFGLTAFALWVLVTLFARRDRGAAAMEAARIVAPALLPALAVVAMVYVSALSRGGVTFGNYEPFVFALMANAVASSLRWAVGGWFAVVLAILALPGLRRGLDAWRAGRGSPGLWCVVALTVPLGVMLFQLGNSASARFFLVPATGFLLLLAIGLGSRAARGDASGWLARAALAAIAIGAVQTDIGILLDRRGDPGAAIDAMASRAPSGTTVAIDRSRSSAVLLAAAAAHDRYRLDIVETPCPAARFLFVDRDGLQPFPVRPVRCGALYTEIATAQAFALSGTHWKLYEKHH